MDIFLIIRVMFVGFIWAGTVYVALAALFMFFPMPTYFFVYSRLRKIAQQQQKKSLQSGALWFERRYRIMRGLGMLLWLAVIGLYIYSFRPILGYYVIPAHADFLKLYGIGVALPSLWLFWRASKALRASDDKTKSLEDNSPTLQARSLIDQIGGPSK